MARAVLDEQHTIAVRIGEAILAENGTALTTMIHLTGRDDVMKRIQEMWEILLPRIMHEDSVEDPKELSGLISRRRPDRSRKVVASA